MISFVGIIACSRDDNLVDADAGIVTRFNLGNATCLSVSNMKMMATSACPSY